MVCEHKPNEDCLICRICGECKESLDEDDVCTECGGKDEDGRRLLDGLENV